jgi:hypothetical protein
MHAVSHSAVGERDERRELGLYALGTPRGQHRLNPGWERKDMGLPAGSTDTGTESMGS